MVPGISHHGPIGASYPGTPWASVNSFNNSRVSSNHFDVLLSVLMVFQCKSANKVLVEGNIIYTLDGLHRVKRSNDN